MNQLITKTPVVMRLFGASLLSFATLMAPITSVGSLAAGKKASSQAQVGSPRKTAADNGAFQFKTHMTPTALSRNVLLALNVLPLLSFAVNATDDASDAVLDGVCDTDPMTSGDQCTLRAAIQEANDNPDDDIISFSLPPNSLIELTGTPEPINGNLAIEGPDSGVTVSGVNAYQVFDVVAGTVSISNLTIINGLANAGGGISNFGDLTISNSTFTGNHAFFEGGAIYSDEGTLTIINSTVSGNTSEGEGGGVLHCGDSTASLVNVTITNNRAAVEVSSLVSGARGPVSKNPAESLVYGPEPGFGGGLAQVSFNTISMSNTIIAGNFVGDSPSTTPDDIFVFSGSPFNMANSFNNLIGDANTSAGFTDGIRGNRVGNGGMGTVDIFTVLDITLAPNGGPTETHALIPNSPAIDMGRGQSATTAELATDQRGVGFPRFVDGNGDATAIVDIGAFEAGPDVTSPTVSIDDGDADDLVHVDSTLTYTIAFSEDIGSTSSTDDDSTLLVTDLDNAGTADFTIGAVIETSPGVFSVQVTPTTIGTIILRIVAGATISDRSGNLLQDLPISDDTTVTVDFSVSDTTTTLASSHPLGVYVGQPVTYTATVASATAVVGPPTGTVNFFDGGNPIPGCNARPLNLAGDATCTTSYPDTVGSPHSITASYNGDPGFNVSTSSALSQDVLPVLNLIVNQTSDEDDADPGDGICDVDLGTPGDQCTLRAAIVEANWFADPSTITFDIPDLGPHLIQLTEPLDFLSTDMKIQGPTDEIVQVSGEGFEDFYNIFSIIGVRGCPPPCPESPLLPIVSISNLIISDGSDLFGGAILNTGSLTISNITFTNNEADVAGGAIYSVGNLFIENSTFTNNHSFDEGGAIAVDDGTLTIVNSTISGNSADGEGGGLLHCGGSTGFLTNVTITGNRTDFQGGGIAQVSSNLLRLDNTIVAGNFLGYGSTPDDIFVDFDFSSGFHPASSNNLIGDADTAGGIIHGDLGNIVGNAGAGTIDIETVLDTILASNGGPTQTHSLAPTSPAIDSGNDTAATAAGLTTDQRGVGFPRFLNGNGDATVIVDIGAFESIPEITPPTLVSIDDGDADNVVPVNFTLTYTVTFNEDIDHSDGGDAEVTAAEFDNAGTAAITIGTILETSPGVFSVQVTPTTGGTIILRIPVGATISDLGGDLLVTPVSDDDTVRVDTPPTLGNYPATMVSFGQSTTVIPDAAPADDVPGFTVQVAISAGFSGSVSVNPTTGVVTVNNPVGPVSGTPYTVTVTANDGINPVVTREFLLTVVKANTGTLLQSSPNPSSFGQQVTFTATVSAMAPGSGTPTGLVDFLDGATVICDDVALNGSGVAICQTSSLTLGNHTMTANYLGDTNFNTSSGGPLTQAVNNEPLSDLAITKNHAGNFSQGQTGASYTIRVTNSGPGPTTGLVTVTDNVPAGLTPTGPTGVVSGWTCSISGQMLTCTRSDVLASGASYPDIILTVNVANPGPISVTNTATVSGGGELNLSNNSASDPTIIDCSQDAGLNNPSPLMISRFRENGPGGATDEFVEIFNPTTTAHRVASGTCTGGYGVFASAGNGTASNSASMVCQIANGTVIPAGGYYLCAGTGYTLGNLGRNGGTAGATATGDSAIGCGGLIGGCAGDIPNDAGLALINIGTNVVINTAGGFAVSGVPASAVIVYDKVGFGPYGPGAPGSAYPSLAGNFCEGGACLRPVGDASLLGTCTDPSGAGLFPVLAAAPACYGQSGQYGLLRRQTTFDPNLGTLHQDSNNGGNDFIFVSPNPGSNTGLTITGVSGVTAVLGAAGPYNLSAPPDAASTKLTRSPFDGFDQLGPRNAERSYVQDPNVANPLNDPLGTFTLRFKYTNNAGVAINGLRFQVDNLSTLCGGQTANPALGTGDARNLTGAPDCGPGSLTSILKAINSTAEVLVDSGGTAQTVNGTVLEDLSATGGPPPAPGPLSPLGGGIDNTLVVNPSTAGASVGDGVTGGTGNFATSMATSGATKELRVKVKFGVVRSGRFLLLLIPMAKTSATP